MIKRRVEFLVAADGGVSPAVPQYGGVKGEHNVTTLAFTCEPRVYEDGDLLRIGFCAGDGTVLSTDILEDVTSDATGHMAVSYPLPQNLTMAGGQLCARLVFSRLDEHGKEIETFRSGEAVLYFDEATVENGTPFWTGVSEMLKRTVTAKDTAVNAQAQAIAAYRDTFAVRNETKDIRDEAKAHALMAEQQYLGTHSLAQEVEDNEKTVRENLQSAVQAAMIATQHYYAADSAAQAAAASQEQAQAAAQTAMQGAYTAASAASTAQNAAKEAQNKLDKSGHVPDMYLGTDGNGNVVTKTAPSGEGGTGLPFKGIGAGLTVNKENGELGVDNSHISSLLADWNALRYQGIVMTVDELASKQTMKGTVYKVVDNDVFYVRVDTGWEPLCVGMNAEEVREIVEEINAKLTAVYRFKGSVDNIAVLDGIQNPQIGDVYNIVSTGMNVAWTGEEWDALGATAVAKDVIAGGTSDRGIHVSGYAVAQYVQAQIQAYDADVMALLGEDEVTA